MVLTKAPIGNIQVPKVDPQVVCRYEVLSVTIRIHRIDVIRMSIAEYSPETRGDRSASHGNPWQRKRPQTIPSVAFSSWAKLVARNLFQFLLVYLPQFHCFIFDGTEDRDAIFGKTHQKASDTGARTLVPSLTFVLPGAQF